MGSAKRHPVADLPPWANDARLRSNFLDPLRLALALAVMVGHAYDLLSGQVQTDPIGRLAGNATSLSSLAVDGFFSLSGFLVTASFLRSRGWRDFLSRRARRIYPAFALANLWPPLLAPVLGLAAVSFSGPLTQSWFSLLHTLVLEGFDPRLPFPANPMHAFNASLWTIRYEATCYLLCGLVLWAPKGRRALTAGVLLALSALVSLTIVGHHQLATWALSHVPSLFDPVWRRFLPDFGAGAVLFLYREKVPRSRTLAAVCFGLLVTAMLVAPSALGVVVPVTLTYLLFFVAFAEPNAVVQRVFARVGDLSYGTYLYAFPVQQAAITVLGAQATPMTVLALSVPPTLVLAALSWWLVERRLLRRAVAA